MSIIADTVDKVSKTKIACFNIGYGRDQRMIQSGTLIVYSTNIDTPTKSNAIILPVYNPGNDPMNIIPINMVNQMQFFYDIDKIYSRWFQETNLLSMDSLVMKGHVHDGNYRKTLQNGDYKIIIIPSKYDFYQIDKRDLTIGPKAKMYIDKHPDSYSFVVLYFNQTGKIEIPPFAYICPFFDESNESMILPTIHGHSNDMGFSDIGKSLGYVPNIFVSHKQAFENNVVFDHTIYCLVKNKINPVNTQNDTKALDALLGHITVDYQGNPIRIYIPKNFTPKKLEVHGERPNRNVLVSATEINFMNDLIVDAPDILFDGTRIPHRVDPKTTPFAVHGVY